MTDAGVVDGLNHVVLAVSDLDAAERFYSTLLGVEFHAYGEHAEEGFKSLYCSKRLELISPTRSDSAVARFLARRGEGVYAVGFRTDDVEAARASAERAGAIVVGEVTGAELEGMPGGGEMRELWIHPKTAHGMQVLLVQGPDDLLGGTAHERA